jgi:hypothetical protein
MSYCIGVHAATKAEAKVALAAKFDEAVVAHQPVHASDRAAALAAGDAFIDLLEDDATKDVAVSLNGWVSYTGGGNAPVALQSASVTASASLVARAA